MPLASMRFSHFSYSSHMFLQFTWHFLSMMGLVSCRAKRRAYEAGEARATREGGGHRRSVLKRAGTVCGQGTSGAHHKPNLLCHVDAAIHGFLLCRPAGVSQQLAGGPGRRIWQAGGPGRWVAAQRRTLSSASFRASLVTSLTVGTALPGAGWSKRGCMDACSYTASISSWLILGTYAPSYLAGLSSAIAVGESTSQSSCPKTCRDTGWGGDKDQDFEPRQTPDERRTYWARVGSDAQAMRGC